MVKKKSFGAVVRQEREAREIGLREMAKKISVSPTYLSMIERDEVDPPTEDNVRKIANIIDFDPDELLALAGRVPSDLADIIRQRPREMADLLRLAKRTEDLADFMTNGLERLVQDANKKRRAKGTKNALDVPNKNRPALQRKKARLPDA
jgi:HTH-type transcriptional regulator, competence development regulator